MTASTVDLRSVRKDQRRVAALLGASRQVPIPPFNYPKVTIDNLFKSRFYRDLEKRGDGQATESTKRLEIQSKHLQSHYNLRKNIEKSVSEKIEAIRNRSVEVSTYTETEHGKRRQTRDKQKKRKVVVDNEGKETLSKVKGRRNSKTFNEEVFEGNSSKKWTWNNLSKFESSTNVSFGSQLSDNSKQQLLHEKAPDKHLDEIITPFRLPKLQISLQKQERTRTSVKLKQPQTNFLPSLPSTSKIQSHRKQAPELQRESVASDGENVVTCEEALPWSDGENFPTTAPAVEGERVQASHSGNQRITTTQSKKGRSQKTSSHESFQNGGSQANWRTNNEDSKDSRPKSTKKIKSDDLVGSATDEHYLKVSELSLRHESEIADHDSSNEYDRMSTDEEYAIRLRPEEYRNPTIRKKIPARVKWDPNSHSEIMRRKLNTLVRKRRQARLDKIRLGQLGDHETDHVTGATTYIDSERAVHVLYESAPDFAQKHSKSKKRGRRKNRVKSRATSRAFSYSYF